MDHDQANQGDTVSVMLATAGVPVPPAEIEQIRRMYQGAATVRQSLRALQLGETEPVTIYATFDARLDNDDE